MNARIVNDASAGARLIRAALAATRFRISTTTGRSGDTESFVCEPGVPESTMTRQVLRDLGHDSSCHARIWRIMLADDDHCSGT
jgi:hypothetical protein